MTSTNTTSAGSQTPYFNFFLPASSPAKSTKKVPKAKPNWLTFLSYRLNAVNRRAANDIAEAR